MVDENGGASVGAPHGKVVTFGAPSATRFRAIPFCAPGAVGFRLEGRAASSAAGRARSPDHEGSHAGFEGVADSNRLGSVACLPVADAFELDLAARELRNLGQPIHLRPREFRLLAALAANPGRAFTRRQLMDLAWDPDTHSDPRTVDVHVHWLRAKIEPTPARPTHLVSIRGFGYRLDPHPR